MSNEVGVEHQPEKVDRLAINIYQFAKQFVFGVSHATDPSFLGVLIHPKQVLAHRGNFFRGRMNMEPKNYLSL